MYFLSALPASVLEDVGMILLKAFDQHAGGFVG